MNKHQYEERFREHPKEIMTALHAAKKIIGELAAEADLDRSEYIRWSTILGQMEKTHGIVAITLPDILRGS
ncbi:MAG TPA: hypothetical protein VEC36_02150 [Patescibacteria group bacterium]|nr:hypothetical protein [Patescibacteria group bacterium]